MGSNLQHLQATFDPGMLQKYKKIIKRFPERKKKHLHACVLLDATTQFGICLLVWGSE